tara:strand:- start:33 stop:185 length:153 start_codon:yes stop_codon:yes gene_type:complete
LCVVEEKKREIPKEEEFLYVQKKTPFHFYHIFTNLKRSTVERKTSIIDIG